MSVHEIRQRFITEQLKELIKSLTPFKEDEENFTLCTQFAWSQFRYHKYLSINSHEMRRRIDGLVERFEVANYHLYAERLKNLCNRLTNTPECLNHYETDIHWGILCFLFELSRRPVAAIQENSDKIILSDLNDVANKFNRQHVNRSIDNLISELKNDNFERSFVDTDSELSEWSDSEEGELPDDILKFNLDQMISRSTDIENTSLDNKTILPPQKPLHFQMFDQTKSEQWLNDNIQCNWWEKNDVQFVPNSSNPEANFCHYWANQIRDLSGNLIELPEISTIPESCLIREILWMFIVPTNCKFFTIHYNEIHINKNVSLASSIPNGITLILNKFALRMTIMLRLNEFCKSVECYDTKLPPLTYEFYSDGLQQLLEPVKQFVIKQEEQLMDRLKHSKMCSVISLFNEFYSTFSYLDKLYDIHLKSVIDYVKHPPYTCASHILSSLLTCNSLSTNSEYSNLSASLFLASVKCYLLIIDKWWTEGCLNDWRNEFLIERTSDDKLNLRPLSIEIQNNHFIRLLQKNCMQASDALDILYTFDRINELQVGCKVNHSIYTTFLDEVFKFFNCGTVANEDTCKSDSKSGNDGVSNPSLNESLRKFCTEIKQIDDGLLFSVFQTSISLLDSTYGKISHLPDTSNYEKTSFELFQRLETMSEVILPFDEIFQQKISKVLESRIAATNKCVMKMYTEEYRVLMHLQNLRKVLLLEASDLMHQFYSKIFKQIESNENWGNSYWLTVQLNGILCSRYPEMASLFSVQIERKDTTITVVDAIKTITIKYNVCPNLTGVINEQCLTEYNQVFRFLLKVKWGLWTLENLRFPPFYKNRIPYAEMNMTDFVFKRLAMARNWIMYSIQSIHSHLMTQVLQSMGQQLDRKIESAQDLNEIIAVHKSYINTIHDHCFQTNSDERIRNGIEDLLNLVYVLREEWSSIYLVKHIEDEGVECSESTEYEMGAAKSQICAIENTYINCHCHMAGLLSSEVYTNNRLHLSGLSAAFNCSCPY